MHFLYTLSALAVLSTSVQAAPAAKGFTVHQVEKAPKVSRRNKGAKAILETFQKFGAPAPHDVQVAAATQTGTVTATPEANDKEYLCTVSVGTPAQNLSLDFDTGSSDLWVFSTLLPSNETSGHTLYNPSTSTTSKSTGGTWSIGYGDGSGASGVVYTDKVNIGGATVTSQAVEAATSVSSTFVSDTQNDGLVGLAFDNINSATPRVHTFMDNVGPTLPADLFTAYLKKGAPGSYDFGFINSAKYSGTITYTSINTANGFWEFTASGYVVGSTSHTLSIDTIADTGTTIIYMPDSLCNTYYKAISGAGYDSDVGGYIYPCSATPPNLGFKISGVTRTVPGSYINFGSVGSGYCFGALQSSDGLPVNILGDVFIKSQFLVFDVGNTRLGIATQK